MSIVLSIALLAEWGLDGGGRKLYWNNGMVCFECCVLALVTSLTCFMNNCKYSINKLLPSG